MPELGVLQRSHTMNAARNDRVWILSSSVAEWTRSCIVHSIAAILWASHTFRVVDSGVPIDAAVYDWPSARLAERVGPC